MHVLAIDHSVADHDSWKAVYDTMPPTSRGAAFARVNRGVDDPLPITVVAGFDSLEVLNSFVADPDLKAAMKQVGVIGAPRFEIYEDVEAI